MSKKSEQMRCPGQQANPSTTRILPKRAVANPSAPYKGYHGLEVTRRFINYTGKSISIIDRHGMKAEIEKSTAEFEPNGSYTQPVLKVFVEYEIPAGKLSLLSVPFVENATEQQSEARMIHEWLHHEGNRAASGVNPLVPIVITFEYVIDPATLRQLGGGAYFESLDLVVCLNDTGLVFTHPYSAMGRPSRELQEKKKDDLDLRFGITIVDNQNVVGAMYTRFAGNLFEIRAIKDSARPDGVYVQLSGLMGQANEFSPRQPEGIDYYPFDDPCLRTVLNLYNTSHEAYHCKSEAEIVAQEQREREALARHEREVELRRFDREAMELKREMSKINQETVNKQAEAAEAKFERDLKVEAERAAAELENQNQKKKYDRENHDMAMQREWIRFIGPAVGALAAIVTTILTIVQLRSKQEKLLGLVSHVVPRLFSFGLGLFA